MQRLIEMCVLLTLKMPELQLVDRSYIPVRDDDDIPNCEVLCWNRV